MRTPFSQAPRLDYPGQAPWPFTGGTIQRAAVDVSGDPFVDLAAEARMAFMRD
jgi:hypothetical protein